jgi:N-acetylmuramidase/Putative peptidoglycan binding domain
MSEFGGKGSPLTEAEMASACGRLSVGLPEIWAVLKVETRGCGFLSDRRPQLLFERHVFHHETLGRFDLEAPDVSDPQPGGYGAPGANQYERLRHAISLDRQAALRSASWGLGHVLGRNAERLGFSDVESMVREMKASEGAQLSAMLAYISVAGLARAMQQRDWKQFALGYNGKNFAENAYDTRLHDAFEHYSRNGTPDLRARTAQVHLRYRGFDPGPVDGEMGNRTRDALRRFQRSRRLSESGDLDDGTFEALCRPRP